jgi:FlaG/FlaF family flagellin (archaellin)
MAAVMGPVVGGAVVATVAVVAVVAVVATVVAAVVAAAAPAPLAAVRASPSCETKAWRRRSAASSVVAHFGHAARSNGCVDGLSVDERIATGWRGLDEEAISRGHAPRIASGRRSIALTQGQERGQQRHRRVSGCHEPGATRKPWRWWRKSERSWQTWARS